MLNSDPKLIYDRLVISVRRFFRDAGRERAVIGLSGGIDSAVVLAIAAHALGKDNVQAILMPSPFSTLHSVTDAVELADNLGVKYSVFPIEGVYNKFFKEFEEKYSQRRCEFVNQRQRSVKRRGSEKVRCGTFN